MKNWARHFLTFFQFLHHLVFSDIFFLLSWVEDFICIHLRPHFLRSNIYLGRHRKFSKKVAGTKIDFLVRTSKFSLFYFKPFLLKSLENCLKYLTSGYSLESSCVKIFFYAIRQMGSTVIRFKYPYSVHQALSYEVSSSC